MCKSDNIAGEEESKQLAGRCPVPRESESQSPKLIGIGILVPDSYYNLADEGESKELKPLADSHNFADKVV